MRSALLGIPTMIIVLGLQRELKYSMKVELMYVIEWLMLLQIFRMKGEAVNGFAFDHCDMDLVALAL